MKKLYALFAGIAFGTAAFAQCTINTSVFNGPNDYSIYPDTINNLPIASVGVGYNTDLQFHIKPDTSTVIAMQTFSVQIRSVHIDSVVGLPAGFTYLPNPSSGTFSTQYDTPPGTGYGCVAVTGTATPGQEAGGPNSDGYYPITVYYTGTVYINALSTQLQQPGQTITGYKLHVVDPNGVPAVEANKFAIGQNTPNPANQSTDFTIGAPGAGQVQLTVYSMLGVRLGPAILPGNAAALLKQGTVMCATVPGSYLLRLLRRTGSTGTVPAAEAVAAALQTAVLNASEWLTNSGMSSLDPHIDRNLRDPGEDDG